MYSKANNKYLEDYDSSKETSYIIYLDANILYGWAMSQKMPHGGFKWRKSTLDFPDNSFVECDLTYPEELFELHDDYPLAPEKIVIEDEWLSDYQKKK